MEKLVILFYLCTNLASCYKHHCPYRLLGLFSISSCQDKQNFQCSLVATNEKIIREMVEKNRKLFDTDLQLCNVDVGTGQRKTIEIFLDLILTKQTSNTCLGGKKTKTFEIKSTFVYMYTTQELTKLASSLALPYDIVIIAVTFEPIYPFPLYDHSLFIYSFEGSFGAQIHKTALNSLRKEMKVTYGAIIKTYLKDQKHHKPPSCSSGSTSDVFCMYTMLSKDGCWKEVSVNVKDDMAMKNIVDAIAGDKRLSFVTTYGTNEAISSFNNKLQQINSTLAEALFLLPFEKEITGNSSFNVSSPSIGTYHRHYYYLLFYDVPGTLLLNALFHLVHHLHWHAFQQKAFYQALQKLDLPIISKYINWLFKQPSLKYVSWHQWDQFWHKGDKTFLKNTLIKSVAYKKKLIAGLLDILKGRLYLDRVKTQQLRKQSTFNPTKALQAKPFCYLTKPKCPRGAELKHSYFKETFWDTSYGWFCGKCSNNFYKSTIGNTKCLPCPKETRSDSRKLFCYDPYKNIVLSFNDSITFAILSSVCFINAVLAVIVLVIFIKYKETPLVRASNIHLSFVQIITHATFSIALIFMFMGRPNRGLCIARPLVIGLCFTLNTTINLGKTLKVFLVFKANLKMSSKEIFMTKASEFLTIITMVVVDFVIFGITIRNKLPSVKTSLDNTNLTREYYCDNNSSIIVHFLAVSVLVVFNVIQGMRSYKLPSYYRESVYLLYSSFSCCIVFLVTTAIYLAQKNEHKRTILLFTVSVVLNLAHFLLMYSYKVYVMIFKPEENTKQAFQAKRWKAQSMFRQLGKTESRDDLNVHTDHSESESF